MSDVPQLPARDPNGHKGTFGSVLVIGGHARNPVMLGGPALAARAALRSGCGLCTLAMPAPLLAPALSVASSATGCELPVDAHGELLASAAAEALDPIIERVQSVVVGPGLGRGFPVQQMVVRLASMVRVPLVIDADALNALSETVDFATDMKAPIVITPHPGEFARLAEALHMHLDAVDPAARAASAVSLAARLGCVVALKGANTVVSDGVRVWTCDAVEPA
ncbi:MAG: NAD(P)H-hydrate dehydratase, partial [Planctomycetaceae bacterium]|nr:NAD(P)H-hydrate dehydratase [Planctomycetaceae bacterium]